MRVIERVLYGSRGQGSLIRYAGVENWYSAYYAHGKEVRESTETPVLKIARRVHRQRLDEVAADRQGLKKFIPPAIARVTINELLDELEADFSLRGVRSLRQSRAHMAPVRAAFGTWRAAEVTAGSIDRYVTARLQTQTRRGTTVAPATVNRESQILGQALRLGFERGKLSALPSMRLLPERNARQGFFEAATFGMVVTNLPDYLQDLHRFAYIAGWRRGEILTLTWADVDRDGGIIKLRAQHSKNGQGRTLAVEGDLAAVIERRWNARVVQGRDSGLRIADLVFHREGRQIVDFRKAWASACRAAGLPVGQGGPLFHDLRRTAARNLVRAGVPERVAMAVTGHKTRSMFDRYNIVNEADLRAAMQQQTAYVRTLPKTPSVMPLAAVQR